MGHAGPMMQEVGALLWLPCLFGVEVDELNSSENYDRSDVDRILEEVVDYNHEEFSVR